MNQLFTRSGQSFVRFKALQHSQQSTSRVYFLLELTGLILQSKGLHQNLLKLQKHQNLQPQVTPNL